MSSKNDGIIMMMIMIYNVAQAVCKALTEFLCNGETCFSKTGLDYEFGFLNVKIETQYFDKDQEWRLAVAAVKKQCWLEDNRLPLLPWEAAMLIGDQDCFQPFEAVSFK